MNLDYTAEQESFRAEVRAFFEAELPADIRSKVRLGRRMHKDDLVRWQKILYRRGWGAGMWPRRYGGARWGGVEHPTFSQKGAGARGPPPDALPQQGISFLLIDMKSPGITVRPIITIDGEHEINDIFFDNVQVPVENLVGEENKGWTYAKFLLSHERTNNAGIGNCKRALKRLKEIAMRQLHNGRPLIEDSRFRDSIARVELELVALEITNLRVLSALATQSRAPGPEVSLLKIKGSEIIQQLAELQMHALGHDALPYLREALEVDWVPAPLLADHYADFAPPLTGQYFNYRKTTIYAGSTEIQKNIISKLILGL